MILVTNMDLIAGLVGVAIACQWFAWWVKLPAILFLLLVGTFVGPMMGWFHPDILFGHWLLPTVLLSVAIILFKGSLSLRWHEVKEHGYVVRNLVTIGIVLTAAVNSAVCSLAVSDGLVCGSIVRRHFRSQWAHSDYTHVAYRAP